MVETEHDSSLWPHVYLAGVTPVLEGCLLLPCLKGT